MTINNVPAYAKNYKYWVVRDCGSYGLYFYGAWGSLKAVRAICKTVGNGKIYVNKDFKVTNHV